MRDDFEDEKPKRGQRNGGWDLPPNLTKLIVSLLGLFGAGAACTAVVIFAPQWTNVFGSEKVVTATYPPATSAASPATAVPQRTSAPTARTSPGGITAQQLDAALGAGSWFCYPDRLNAVGVRRLNQGVTVSSPILYMDTPYGTFEQGAYMSAGNFAHAELNAFLDSVNECPANQRPFLDAWRPQPPDDFAKYLDNVFGKGNWGCDNTYWNKVEVFLLRNNLLVEYPFTAADQYQKYGVGDTVPAGNRIAAWTFVIPRIQCP